MGIIKSQIEFHQDSKSLQNSAKPSVAGNA